MKTVREIKNLKAQMQGRDLNIYQKADALIELEQLTIPCYKNVI